MIRIGFGLVIINMYKVMEKGWWVNMNLIEFI